jgi:hypothetical protein
MPVRVLFEEREDVWIPLFEPERSEGGERARGEVEPDAELA